MDEAAVITPTTKVTVAPVQAQRNLSVTFNDPTFREIMGKFELLEGEGTVRGQKAPVDLQHLGQFIISTTENTDEFRALSGSIVNLGRMICGTDRTAGLSRSRHDMLKPLERRYDKRQTEENIALIRSFAEAFLYRRLFTDEDHKTKLVAELQEAQCGRKKGILGFLPTDTALLTTLHMISEDFLRCAREKEQGILVGSDRDQDNEYATPEILAYAATMQVVNAALDVAKERHTSKRGLFR